MAHLKDLILKHLFLMLLWANNNMAHIKQQPHGLTTLPLYFLMFTLNVMFIQCEIIFSAMKA